MPMRDAGCNLFLEIYVSLGLCDSKINLDYLVIVTNTSFRYFSLLIALSFSLWNVQINVCNYFNKIGYIFRLITFGAASPTPGVDEQLSLKWKSVILSRIRAKCVSD